MEITPPDGNHRVLWGYVRYLNTTKSPQAPAGGTSDMSSELTPFTPKDAKRF